MLRHAISALAFALQLAPPAGAVVRHNRLDQLDKCRFVHRFTPVHLDCPSGLIALPLIDDSFPVLPAMLLTGNNQVE